MGFFDKIKQSLTRTKEQFVGRFDEIVRRADEPAQRSRPVDVETVEALEEALISADVGVAATDQIVTAVREIFPLNPKGIIEYLNLRRPIYKQTAAYGHFGRTEPDFSWERADKAETLRALVKK